MWQQVVRTCKLHAYAFFQSCTLCISDLKSRWAMGEANLRPTSYQLHLKSSGAAPSPCRISSSTNQFLSFRWSLASGHSWSFGALSEHRIKNLQPAVIDYDDFGMPGMYTYGYNYSDGCHIFDSNGCARMYEYIGVQSCTGVYSIRISADPACSRGSASEEKLQAARSMARGPFWRPHRCKQQGAKSKKWGTARSKKQVARGPFWRPESCSFELASSRFESDVRHRQQAEVTIVSKGPFWRPERCKQQGARSKKWGTARSKKQVARGPFWRPERCKQQGARSKKCEQQGAKCKWREVRFGGLRGASSKEQEARSEEQQGARSTWREVRFGGLRGASSKEQEARSEEQQGARSTWREVPFGGLRRASSKEQEARSEERQGARSKWREVCFGGLRCKQQGARSKKWGTARSSKKQLARGPFWRPESCSLELASSRFRKRR